MAEPFARHGDCCLRQRIGKEGLDVGLQILDAAGAERHDVHAGFVAREPISGVDDAEPARPLGQERQRRRFIDCWAGLRGQQVAAPHDIRARALQQPRSAENETDRKHQQGRHAACLRRRQHALARIPF